MVTRSFLIDKMMETLTVGCVHLMTGNASLEFPSSSTASPSRMVIVILTPKGELWDGARAYFPMRVQTRTWHLGVVPVLESEFIQVEGINESLMAAGRWSDYKGKMREALIASFRSVGLLPEEVSSTGATVSSTSETEEDEAPGEPVDREPWLDESEYARVDEDQGAFSYRQLDL